MKQAMVVVLLGTSILMDGIASSLMKETAVKMVRLEDINTCHQTDWSLSHPDIIAFEMESLPASELLRLMPDFPEAHWVGLDPHCSQVSVMSSRRYKTKGLKDLLCLIQAIVPGVDDLEGGKWSETTMRVLSIQV